MELQCGTSVYSICFNERITNDLLTLGSSQSNCTGKYLAVLWWHGRGKRKLVSMFGGSEVCKTPTSHTSLNLLNPRQSKYFLLMPVAPPELCYSCFLFSCWNLRITTIHQNSIGTILKIPKDSATSPVYCANLAASAYAPAAPCLLLDAAMQQRLGQPPRQSQGPLNVTGFGWYWKAAV